MIMTRNKYRIVPYSYTLNIWILQRRVLWIFWRSLEAGKKHELEALISELNKQP